MKARRTRLGAVATVVCAVLAFGLAGTAGSANENKLVLTPDDFPGPSEVTYGKTVASTFKLDNPSTNPWNKVIVTFTVPTSGTETAKLKSVNVCPGKTENLDQQTDVVCDLGTMAPGASNTFLIVWQTFSSGSSAGCVTVATPCFKTLVKVTGVEGTVGPDKAKTGRKDMFESFIDTKLLNTPGADKDRAGTFALSACTTSATPTLTTNLTLNATTNPLSTAVCAPELADLATDGIPVLITEGNVPGAPGKTQVSTICIPKAPGKCKPGESYTPFPFTQYATFTIVVSNGSFNGQITKVFYDTNDTGPPSGFAELPFGPGTEESPNPTYVESITPLNSQGITTIVVKSKHNGRFNGG